MPSTAGAHLARLQLLVASVAVVVAITSQPVVARATSGMAPKRLPIPALSVVTHDRPVRIAAALKRVRDGRGRSWESDVPYAVGGQLVASAHPIARTASAVLYQHARLGVRSYQVPVATPGTYFVDMFVAETQGARPGTRVWDVTAEGRTAAVSVDVAHMVGRNRAAHVVFFAPVVDGTLNLHVTARQGVPLVGAVEVDWRNGEMADRTLFTDGFDGVAGQPPNPLNWSRDVGGGGFGNQELQTYTSRPRNAALDGAGHLLITARHEKVTGTDGITRHYTSARLKTAGHFTFRYGTAEARIRVPAGDGLWPAFWAMGSNFAAVGWPRCGEMDVMENRGSQPRVSHATAHGSSSDGLPWQAGRRLRLPHPLRSDYHTFRVVWGPSAMAMSVDGRTYSSVSSADIAPNAHWNFKHPFYLLLDLAVGGVWPGPPTASTHFPATLAVDYVTVRG